VGRIYLGERFINLEMVSDGFAWRYPQYDKPRPPTIAIVCLRSLRFEIGASALNRSNLAIVRAASVSSAEVAEPSSDLAHDLVDLVGMQEGWLFFQLSTPFHQDPSHRLMLVMALFNDLLDGHFPLFKTHRLTAAAPVVVGLFRLCGKGISLWDSYGGRKDARLAISL
jgi:hypothetical protein